MKTIRDLLPLQSEEMLHLDLLRFLASVGIVVHHSKEFFLERATRAAGTATTQALSIFVDLFFVISGFVIAHVYHAKVGTPSGYATYLKRRLARLLPLHWLTFAVSVAVYAAIAASGLKAQHQIPFDPVCMASTLALAHSFFGCSSDGIFNGVSWSLSAEMVMYVAFPVLLFAASRMGRLALAAGVALAGLFVVTFMLARPGFTAFDWAEILPPLRALPAFFFGICLYFGRSALARLPVARALTWASTALLVAAMLSGVQAAVVLVLAYVVATAAVAADQQRLAGQVVRELAPLGQLTYSMYLIHPVLVLVLMNGLGDKVLKLSTAGMVAMGAVCYAAILVLSYVSLVRFETPTRRWLERSSSSSTTAPRASPVA